MSEDWKKKFEDFVTRGVELYDELVAEGSDDRLLSMSGSLANDLKQFILDVEADSHFKLGKVYPNLTRKAVVKYLRDAAEVVEGLKAERFSFEFVIEEIKEAKK